MRPHFQQNENYKKDNRKRSSIIYAEGFQILRAIDKWEPKRNTKTGHEYSQVCEH